MLDIKYIRENLEVCKAAAVNKNRQVEWDQLLQADDQRREFIQKAEKLRAERNQIGGDKEQGLVRGKALKQELRAIEERLREVDAEFIRLMLTVPNVPDASVPVGKDESENKQIKTWGQVPRFDFPVRDHVELAKLHDLIDFERGAKVSGSRGYFLKNAAAQLEFAVLSYAFQKLIKKGYTPITAPSLVKEFTLLGSGHLPWGGIDVYALEKDNLFLSATAEIPVTAYFADEILKEEDLPKKFVAFSPCFRREAGSYGKDTKGVYRIHQFNKIEQVIISTNDMNNSLTLHEELLANSEGLLQDLEIPYRVLLMCTGDMGEPQVKKYDIEAWMPGRPGPGGKDQGNWGETMSNSVMGDFQARRLKLRYRAKSGAALYCHTLNNTAIASPRILVAILENGQRADGSIVIPKVLQPFMGAEVIGYVK